MGSTVDTETPEQGAKHRGVDPSSPRAPEHDPALVVELPGFLEDLQRPPRQGNPVLALPLHAAGGDGQDIVLDLVPCRASNLVRACRRQDHELERQPTTGVGRQVEGRTGPSAPRLEPVQGPQDTYREEPHSGRSFRGGVPSAAEGVRRGGLALPRRARARARDRTPHRGRPTASLVRHRLRRQDHPVARGAREDRVRTPYTRDRRGGGRVGVGAEGQYPKRRRPGHAVAEEYLDVRDPLNGPHMVGEGRGPRRT